MRWPRVRFTVWRLMVAVVVCAPLSHLFAILVIRPMMVAAWDQGCQANLRAIGLALQAYHDDHGCYPRAYTTDASGRPMHSWRALILPYVGESDLFRAYRFDEPWDGPNNTRLARHVPAIYQCRAHPHPGPSSYAVIVGPGTVFPGSSCVSASQIKDPRACLVVELGGAGIPWLEPRDLKLPPRPSISGNWQKDQEGAETDIDDLRRQGLASEPLHPHGANFLFSPVQVETWWLFGRGAGLMLRSMLTIDGGEIWYLDDRL
jgi:Protein of unknown function (DUF1559)